MTLMLLPSAWQRIRANGGRGGGRGRRGGGEEEEEEEEEEGACNWISPLHAGSEIMI
jgi:hypothetical protein